MRALLLTEETIARAIEGALRPHGYSVERAEYAAQAEAQARRGWALIVLDWDRLGAGAAELCRTLGDSSGAIVLALARDAAAILPDAVAAGADDAIELPRDEARLPQRIAPALLRAHGPEDDEPTRPAPLADIHIDLPPEDGEPGNDTLVELPMDDDFGGDTIRMPL